MKERRMCKCDCGGQVWGVRQWGRWWVYCDRCSSVVTVPYPWSKA